MAVVCVFHTVETDTQTLHSRCVPSLCGSGLQSPPGQSPCIGMGATSKNFWGFQLLDEPASSLFGKIGNWTSEIEAQRPGVLTCEFRKTAPRPPHGDPLEFVLTLSMAKLSIDVVQKYNPLFLRGSYM